jgi:homoserine acetyltransferase
MRFVHCIFDAEKGAAYTRSSVFEMKLFHKDRQQWKNKEQKRAEREKRVPEDAPKLIEVTLDKQFTDYLRENANMYRIIKPYVKWSMGLMGKHLKTLKKIPVNIEFTYAEDDDKNKTIAITHPMDMFSRKRGRDEATKHLKSIRSDTIIVGKSSAA